MPKSEYEFKTEQSLWDEYISMDGLEKYLETNYREVEWKRQVRTIFEKIDFKLLKNFLKAMLTRKQWIDESDLIALYKKAFTVAGGDRSILANGWMTGYTQYYPHHVLAELVQRVQKNWKWYGDNGGVFIQDSDTKKQNWISKPFSGTNLDLH